MKKSFIKSFLLIWLITISNQAFSSEISDEIGGQEIFKKMENHLLKTTQIFEPIISRAKVYQQKPERDILGLKIKVEKKRIDEKRKNNQLTFNYCFSLSDFENFTYCSALLEEQEKDCQNSPIKGNNVYVDLGNQVLYAVKNCEVLVYARIISGKNTTPSPTGSYKIYHARGPHWMQGEWFVNMAFYFRGGFALHDAGWRQGVYWKKENRGYYGSHGCINMPKEAMDIIWANFTVGDGVYLYYKLPEDIAEKLNQKVVSKEIIDPAKDL